MTKMQGVVCECGRHRRLARASVFGYDNLRMSTVLELEQAVGRLPDEDFQAFAAWFDDVRAQRVDAAFEKSILAGEFDAMAARALESMQAGQTTPLDAFLRRA